METPERSTWFLSRRLFLAGIAATYAIAFGSLGVQVQGLFGSRGIQPLAGRLEALGERFSGWDRLQLPSLFWFGASDGILTTACVAGLVLALLALAGLLPRLALALCWALYLSFTRVGWPFLSFQWDVLLLEAGLLAVLFAPGGLRPFGRTEREPSGIVRWLVYWLLFRLMVESGTVKLASGDPSWWDGSALDFHFWTQPLPHRLSVLAHETPRWLKDSSVFLMFVIELGLPWLLFVPVWRARLRQVVAAGVVVLMALIALTGNYGFFNWLTCVLCIPLLDDRAWRTFLRRRAPPGARAADSRPLWRRVALGVVAALVVLLTTARAIEDLERRRGEGAGLLGLDGALVRLAAPLERLAGPLLSFNAYGLFAAMTKERPEILVEGSPDGVEWKPYLFRYKPDELERAPVFAGLHMPRLDWQLWFVGLEHDLPRRSSWTEDFLRRLLEGSPTVLALLRENPFPDGPPRFVRARVAPYEFASPEDRAQGRRWRRGEARLFLPVLERPGGSR